VILRKSNKKCLDFNFLRRCKKILFTEVIHQKIQTLENHSQEIGTSNPKIQTLENPTNETEKSIQTFKRSKIQLKNWKSIQRFKRLKIKLKKLEQLIKRFKHLNDNQSQIWT
jgi:hypothetical protein